MSDVSGKTGIGGSGGDGRTRVRRAPRRPCSRAGRVLRSGCTVPTRGPVAAVTSLHTLGPAGTNCERSAVEWFVRAGRAGRVVLYPTLEDAARGALATPGGALLVPAAYPDLHTLVYSHVEDLTLVDSIVVPTHPMVLARAPEATALGTVATHAAPIALVPPGITVRVVSSNAQAAADCAAGLADACITTSAAMDRYGLELVRDFGAVQMAFTVHVPTRPATAPSEYDAAGSRDD
ncbi:MAG TPA: hypothetical protein VF045_01915 [Acidimicrobiales bacterium]